MVEQQTGGRPHDQVSVSQSAARIGEHIGPMVHGVGAQLWRAERREEQAGESFVHGMEDGLVNLELLDVPVVHAMERPAYEGRSRSYQSNIYTRGAEQRQRPYSVRTPMTGGTGAGSPGTVGGSPFVENASRIGGYFEVRVALLKRCSTLNLDGVERRSRSAFKKLVRFRG